MKYIGYQQVIANNR